MTGINDEYVDDFVFHDSDLDAQQAQTSEALTFDDGRLKTASFDSSRGFGLRCVAGETTGFAQGTDLSPGALSRASNAVIMAKAGHKGTLAAAPLRTNTHLYEDIDPIAHPDFG